MEIQVPIQNLKQIESNIILEQISITTRLLTEMTCSQVLFVYKTRRQ